MELQSGQKNMSAARSPAPHCQQCRTAGPPAGAAPCAAACTCRSSSSARCGSELAAAAAALVMQTPRGQARAADGGCRKASTACAACCQTAARPPRLSGRGPREPRAPRALPAAAAAQRCIGSEGWQLLKWVGVWDAQGMLWRANSGDRIERERCRGWEGSYSAWREALEGQPARRSSASVASSPHLAS